MTFTQKTLIAFVLACTPITALAAVPPTITSVQAVITNGVLTVSWQAPADNAAIAFYRVYFSRESIMENDGNYDDFERTAGKGTTYTFTKLPLQSPRIFVAVLAVNTAGVESDGFETETSVSVPQKNKPTSSQPSPASSSSAAPQTSAASTALPMSLVSVSAISQTGILLTFTKTLAAAQFGTDEFFITDMSGAILEIRGVTVSGSTLLLSTSTQEPDREYLFGSLQPIPATDGTNLPTSNAQVHFRGFQSQTAASNQTALQASVEPAPVPYVRNPMLGQATSGLPVLPIDQKPIPGTAKSKGKNGLPDSGIGLFGIVGLAGLLAGRRLLKRKEKETVPAGVLG